MEECPYCHKPVLDTPPNVAVHAECWLEAIIKQRREEECLSKAGAVESVRSKLPKL